MNDGSERSACPLSRSLELLGDRWSLLIVRDMIFNGSRHYGDFIASDEGISTNILADRLKRLEQHGILVRREDPDDRKRVLYGLTDKGLDLLPVLLELIVWSGRYQKPCAVPREFLKRLREDRAAVEQEFRARLRSDALSTKQTASRSKPER